jgi:hypothetical protein
MPRQNGGFQGDELSNAMYAHARMGYNFYVPTVGVKVSSSSTRNVDVDVTVQQIGVAPFYYDLDLGIQCTGMNKKVLRGVDTLIDKDSKKIFSFTGLPATSECLNAVSITLESSYAYRGRPIKFAQGNGALVVNLPLPSNLPPSATQSRPVSAPVRKPASSLDEADADAPTNEPVQDNSIFGKLFARFKDLLKILTPL